MDLGEKAHIEKATARGNALEQGRTCIQLGHAGSPQQEPQEMQPHLSSIHTNAKKTPSSFQGIQAFRTKTAPERTRLALKQANKRKKTFTSPSQGGSHPFYNLPWAGQCLQLCCPQAHLLSLPQLYFRGNLGPSW